MPSPSRYRPVRIPGLPEETVAALFTEFRRLADEQTRQSRSNAVLALQQDRAQAAAGQSLRVSPPPEGMVVTLPAPDPSNTGESNAITLFIESPAGNLDVASTPKINPDNTATATTVNGVAMVRFRAAGVHRFFSNGVNQWQSQSELPVAVSEYGAESTDQTGAPLDAEYWLKSASADLPNARVPVDSSDIRFDYATPGVVSAKLKRGFEQGPPGTDGRDGSEGTPGITGDRGPQGLQGDQGAPGYDGTPGNDGVPGQGIDGIRIRKNSVFAAGPRQQLNLIEGSGIGITIADDGPDGEVDITIAASGGGGAASPPPGLVLSATSHSLEVVTGTGADVNYQVSFEDLAAGALTPGSSAGLITTATTTTVQAAPGASTQRTITNATIVNIDVTAQTVTIQKDVGPGTNIVLFGPVTLGPAERVEFTSDMGWRTFDSLGRERAPSPGLLDGDYGDITVTGSGTTWTIDNDVVTNPKLANMVQGTIKGRADAAGTGDPTDLTPQNVADIVDGANFDFSGAINFISGTFPVIDSSLYFEHTNRLNLSGVSVMALTTPIVDDFALSNGATVIRLTSTAIGRTLAGIAKPGAAGESEFYLLYNAEATNPSVIGHQQASSVAANRIICPGQVDLFLAPGAGCIIWYDANVLRWRVVECGIIAATQAEMEAATVTNCAVTPARQHFHPSACKAWGSISGTAATVFGSYNITSQAHTSTGVTTVTISTAFSSANYSAVATGANAAATARITYVDSGASTASTFVIRTVTTAGVAVDPSAILFACFGDQ